MAKILGIPTLALHEQAVQHLRAMLVEGRIVPGAKLNERELCEELHVSRTPLREAIKLLAGEGLVDLLPNRGAIAVTLSEADILNTFEVLAALEGVSGELAAQRITDAQRIEVRAMHYEMLACFTRRELPRYYQLNARIHAAINEAADNAVLTSTYRSINARVQFLRFRTNQNEANWKQAVDEHGLMIDALDARDAAGLKSVLTSHLMHKRDTVLLLMREGKIYSPTAQFDVAC